jgi:gas vesicle protein
VTVGASRAGKLAAKAEKRAARRGRRGGLVVGVVAGVALGLLVAPRSGKETRALLFGEGGLGARVDRVRGALGAGKDSAADQSEVLRRKIEETRERLRKQMDLSGEEATSGSADAG